MGKLGWGRHHVRAGTQFLLSPSLILLPGVLTEQGSFPTCCHPITPREEGGTGSWAGTDSGAGPPLVCGLSHLCGRDEAWRDLSSHYQERRVCNRGSFGGSQSGCTDEASGGLSSRGIWAVPGSPGSLPQSCCVFLQLPTPLRTHFPLLYNGEGVDIQCRPRIGAWTP